MSELPAGALPGPSSAAAGYTPAASPASAVEERPAEPVAVRQARTALARLAGADLATRIAGYDEVHRLLRESLTALDAGAVHAPSGAA